MLLKIIQIKLNRHASHLPKAYNIRWAITKCTIEQKKRQCADK